MPPRPNNARIMNCPYRPLSSIKTALAAFILTTLSVSHASAAGATPDAPTGLASDVTENRVVLTWDVPEDDDGVEGYNVYRDNRYLTTVLENRFEGDLEPGRLHTFSVVAFDAAPRNFSPVSDNVFVPEDLIPEDTTIPPSVPQSLQGDITGSSLVLSWQASTDDERVLGYNVYQNNRYLTTVFSPEYTGTVTAGQAYSYYVVAFDSRHNFSARSAGLNLPDSGPGSGPVDTNVAPEAPTNLAAVTREQADGLVVSLTWTAARDDRGVSGYNVYVDGAYRTTVFSTGYEDTITSGQSFNYSVVAFDIDGNFSRRTAELLAPESAEPIDPDSPPSQPQRLTGTVDNEGDLDAVSLTWQASTDNLRVLGYNVYINNDYASTVFDTRYTTTVAAGSVNRFYVVAFDAQSNFSSQSIPLTLPESASSGEDQPPSAASGLEGAINDAGNTVEFSWRASTDDNEVAGYNVYRNNQYISTVFETRYRGAVAAGEVYSFHVVAFDDARNFSLRSETLTLPDTGNQAPFFVNLDDQLIEAGSAWELVIQPQDADSGVPGLFIGTLPTGARNVDNFDGTRSLLWQPLQPDVGDYRVRITAFDADDSSLTTVRDITLSVVLPDDLSTIPNRPPTIDAIGDYVVRAGDPVVMRAKAVDANGTVPNLSILNPPDGATFTPLADDPRVRVLRFTSSADDRGVVEYNFFATDADDSALRATGSATIDFRDAGEFVRPGSRLKDLATQAGIQFGYASLLEITEQADGALYNAIAADEFNLVTPENSMKWGYINPQPGVYRWEDADKLVAFAAANNMDVHGHALVWYTQLPQWIQRSRVDERESLMYDFIDSMTARYPDVTIWDVVNEALEDDGSFRNSVWQQAMGEQHIDKAFIRTRAADPDAVLIYNDYDVAAGGAKTDAMYRLVSRLVDANVPIDGVGFQMHVDTDFTNFTVVRDTFQRFADLGVDIYITELDVNMLEGASEQDQAEVFSGVVDACLNQAACKAIQIWGFTDRYTWRRPNTPLVLDRNYQPKPAYEALQRALAGE